jgi:hypothetical protein
MMASRDSIVQLFNKTVLVALGKQNSVSLAFARCVLAFGRQQYLVGSPFLSESLLSPQITRLRNRCIARYTLLTIFLFPKRSF